MLQNIKLTVAYDGNGFLGWQKTKEGPSIEETLQEAIEAILQEPITLQAASRTDSGVHAQGQVVNFFTHKIWTSEHLLAINRRLPKTISVLNFEEVPLSFHPTLDCLSKEYHYWICRAPYQLPHHRYFSWHIHLSLDIAKMAQGAKHLIGRHDFSSFTNFKKNETYSDTIREVSTLEIKPYDNRCQIIIKGNHFLYKMVRNIVGTLVEVGKGKMPPEKIATLLKEKYRPEAGPTAPAHGLTLFNVYYLN